MNNFIEKIKKYNITLIFCGVMAISGGLVIDNAKPWIDQIELTNIEMCIADIHFRNHTETQFQKCVSPNLENIENIQKLSLIINSLYSLGGIFIGIGFGSKK